MNNWTDFNSADDQQSYDLIPKGTLAKVRMTIRPGGYDDPNEGWTGGYATRKAETGSVYLNCEFVVTEGPYARRKVWSLIGLHSPKSAEWMNMGRAFIKGILNSARGVHPSDETPQAQNARRIQGLVDLDGIEFVAKIDVEQGTKGDDKNVIKQAIAPDHKEYATVMGAVSAPAPASAATQTTNTANAGRPSWAQ
ncbi:MAG: hypothetical protein ACE5FN_12805 [Leptospirillia bacterium]